MQEILVSELKRHPLADVVKGWGLIKGREYESFVQPVKNFGTISSIGVALENVAISGWTQVRACKDLEINLIPAIIRGLVSDDGIEAWIHAQKSKFSKVRHDYESDPPILYAGVNYPEEPN